MTDDQKKLIIGLISALVLISLYFLLDRPSDNPGVDPDVLKERYATPKGTGSYTVDQETLDEYYTTNNGTPTTLDSQTLNERYTNNN